MNIKMQVLLLVILCLSLLLDTVWTAPSTSNIKSDSDDSGLTGLDLAPPDEVQSGETVRLPCNYELNGVVLHSVKWYRNDQEFIRYVPKEVLPFRIFPLPGLHIDLAQTNERMVTLLKVDHHSTGTYKCEVSVNSTRFHTYTHSTQLRVKDVPVGEPDISAEKLRDTSGEQIQVISTAPPSNPAANFTGPLNDRQGCKPGETFMDENDCNRCRCLANGSAVCTKMMGILSKIFEDL